MKDTVKKMIEKEITISTMESCTGGAIASAITMVEGSSAIFPGGYVTYSNKAKVMAGVPEEIIEKYGVYSEQTARAMAEACQKNFNTDLGVGVTGTFQNADPNNKDSKPGVAYVVIAAGDVCFTTEIKINFSETYGRNACKKDIVKIVAEEIDKLIA